MALGAGNKVAFEGFHINALLSDEKSVKRTVYCEICLFRNRAFSLSSQFEDALVLLCLALVLKSSATFPGVLSGVIALVNFK